MKFKSLYALALLFCSINFLHLMLLVNTLMQNLKSHPLPLVKSTALSMQKAMLQDNMERCMLAISLQIQVYPAELRAH